MQLRIQSREFFPEATVGSLMVDSIFECFTYERGMRSDRLFLPCESALPRGRYNVSLEYSKRFQRQLPLLASTGPAGDRREVRIGMWIHPGHPRDETLGTLLLGSRQSDSNVRGTRDAFMALFDKLLTVKMAGAEAIDMEVI